MPVCRETMPLAFSPAWPTAMVWPAPGPTSARLLRSACDSGSAALSSLSRVAASCAVCRTTRSSALTGSGVTWCFDPPRSSPNRSISYRMWPTAALIPLLIGVYGAALMAAGLLRADPADGCRPRPAPCSRCGYSAA